MTYISNRSVVNTQNSTNAVLTSGTTFTGTWFDVSGYNSITVAVVTDQIGSLFVDFSPNASDADGIITFSVAANTNEVHRLTVTRQYFRVRFTNTSGLTQTFLRLQTMTGSHPQLSSPLSLSVQQDADTTVVRAVDSEIDIANGKYTGYMVVNKFGRNPDIDTGSVPEDVWDGGSTYAGFPTGAPEEFQALSTNAGDTGVLTFTYLASSTSTEYQTATVTLNGTTPVNTGVTGYRMHTAQYASGSATTFNLGDITLRHRTTTANIFCVMPIGRSQTNVSAYTVPAGSTGHIRRLFCAVIGSSTGTADGALWVRTLNGSPRLRRPFSAATSDRFEEKPFGGISITAGSDIVVRVSNTSANNVDVIAGYDLVLIKNT